MTLGYLRLLRCAPVLLGLPVLGWATYLATFANSNLCHSPTSGPAITGIAYPSSRASFLPGGEAAPVGPGYTPMDFAGHLWYPPRISGSFPFPTSGDMVTMASPSIAEYRFGNGTVVHYQRVSSGILCEATVLSGLGITVEFFVYLGGAVLALSLICWVLLPRCRSQSLGHSSPCPPSSGT